MKYLLGLFLLLACGVDAGSVRLSNNSSYQLRAVIRGGDGSYLGEVLVNPQQTMSWNDYNGAVAFPNQSLTPYTVLWFCNDEEGSPYAICTDVGSGFTVVAKSCVGTRSCKPKQKQQTPPNQAPPTEEYLQKQAEKAAGPPQGELD
jgi:hypothetical protein